MEKKRKRRHCQRCGDEFSDRHFRRHNCKDVQCDSGEEEEQESVEDNIIQYLENTYLPWQTSAMPLPKNITEEDRLMYFESIQSQVVSSLDSESDNSMYEAAFEDAMSDSETQIVSEKSSGNDYIWWIIKALLKWQSCFFIPDRAFSYILILIKSVLYLCSNSSDFMKALYQDFPVTIYQMNKFVSFSKDNFKKCVVCTKCFKLYDYENCFDVIEGRKVSSVCGNVAYPCHSSPHLRRACGEALLKIVHSQNGDQLTPFKTYCYRKLEDSISDFVKRSGSENKCELWRQRKVPSDVLMDVYDGTIWHEFSSEALNFFY
ncbi:hypothetical protein ACJMK2_038810 [Sinanodonta woodiana]|uniref:C2H2-type domain-containing protein n=1 Tax=Sinanodonta woodiana TaxID=1069815 RepID=A0ABD3WA28_SINWO